MAEDFRVVDDTPRESDQLVYQPARQPALPQPAAHHSHRRRRGQAPDYIGITAGSVLLKMFSILQVLAGILYIAKAIGEDSRFAPMSPVTLAVIAVPLFCSAVFFWMVASVADAVRDIAVNSFD